MCHLMELTSRPPSTLTTTIWASSSSPTPNNLAMQGRFAALSAELDRIRRELSIIHAELDAAGRTAAPIPALLWAGKEQLLDRLIGVIDASSAETEVYVTEMLPHLHALLDRVHRRTRT